MTSDEAEADCGMYGSTFSPRKSPAADIQIVSLVTDPAYGDERTALGGTLTHGVRVRTR